MMNEFHIFIVCSQRYYNMYSSYMFSSKETEYLCSESLSRFRNAHLLLLLADDNNCWVDHGLTLNMSLPRFPQRSFVHRLPTVPRYTLFSYMMYRFMDNLNNLYFKNFLGNMHLMYR